MATTLVLDRIAAWERSGVIDHELAERLRATEAGKPEAEPAMGRVEPASDLPGAIAMPAARARSSGFIIEFFAYLGGLFLLLAWYAWFVNDLPASARDRDIAVGVAALVPAVLLGVVGWVLAGGATERLRRAAAVALVVAVPNAGVAAWSWLHAAGVDRDGGISAVVAGTVVAIGVAAAGRVRLPADLTQAALIAAWAAFALALSQWVQDTLWPPAPDGGITRADDQERLFNAVRLCWWWLVAAVPAAFLYLRPDTRPGRDTRTAIARIGIGAIAVLGSASAALATYQWPSGLEGESIFGAWIAAAIMLAVGGVFVVAARLQGSRIHLVTAGAAILIALSYLNAQYVAEAVGSSVALLVEGLILLGVAGLGWVAGRYVTRRGPAAADAG